MTDFGDGYTKNYEFLELNLNDRERITITVHEHLGDVEAKIEKFLHGSADPYESILYGRNTPEAQKIAHKYIRTKNPAFA
jgi:hypothetical protein